MGGIVMRLDCWCMFHKPKIEGSISESVEKSKGATKLINLEEGAHDMKKERH